ncbi:MarR family winged helix-turn-helix transcriptional regulator [Xylanimonas oleitrophica]|uniref:MarR family winged helix-turn-helix transcriptional regulator n=1 Tax=Xylanimonas oleitrophica TaxID=2607479 RepID=UPI001FEA7493|nr:MarR family transcriptional regulator [Xylanimonas oleitrophica]
MQTLSPSSASPVDTLFASLEELSRAQREAGVRLARELDWPRAGLGVIRMLATCGQVQLTDIATKLRVDASVASRQVSQLVDAGYVRRTVDADDRRVRLLELTESGHELSEHVSARFAELLSTVFHDWSEQDLAEATHHIRRVAAAITTIHDEEGTH